MVDDAGAAYCGGMSELPSRTVPAWQRDSHAPTYPPLRDDAQCDVAVLGGGIAGLTAALELARGGGGGRSVIVLEMHRVAGGTSGHSTGHLEWHSEIGYVQLISKFGEQKTRTLIDAKRDAVDYIEAWSAESGGEGGEGGDFVRVPAYFYAEDETGAAEVQLEVEASARLGYDADLLGHAPLPFSTTAAMRLDHQARHSPLAYVRLLARLCIEAGVTIHEETRLTSHEELDETRRSENRNRRIRVTTDRGVVSCDHLVLCGHAPTAALVSAVSRAFPYQSYVIAVRVKEGGEPIEDALYWDTAEPYHYIRRYSSDDPTLLVIGGADHRTGSHESPTQSRFEELEVYARERFDVAPGGVESAWSHEFWEPADGVPYIGCVPRTEHTYMACAFSGEGLTLGTAAGRLLADLILNRDNPLEEVTRLDRVKPLASANRLVRGGLHFAKRFVGDRLRGGDADSVDAVPVGEGRLVDSDDGLLAVYRDDEGEGGEVHVMSPVCTHLGCIVQWNDAERTWDCPCHGGRYDAKGTVIMGPPDRDLERREG